jgi:hypothetical protein
MAPQTTTNPTIGRSVTEHGEPPAVAPSPPSEPQNISKVSPQGLNKDQAAQLALVTQQLEALTLAVQSAIAVPRAPAASQLPKSTVQIAPPGSQDSYSPLTVQSIPPMSERVTLSIPVPLIDWKEPFLTLRQWDMWHDQVTDCAYKNVQGTHAAISILMRLEANELAFATGPAQIRQFQKIVATNLLLTHKPRHAKDSALWTAFKHHFRQCLDVTTEREESHLHDTLYSRKRKMGESLYGFSTDFCTAALQYNQIC